MGGLYEREVRFYAEIAPALGDGGGTASPFAPCCIMPTTRRPRLRPPARRCHARDRRGDEIRGATPQQAALALHQLGLVHGPLLGNPPDLAGAAWLNRDAPINQALIAALYAAFSERYADRIEPRHREVCERLVGAFDAYLAQEAGAAKGLVHGDYRLDNMLFGTADADRPLTVVDWQTVTWGPALTDVATSSAAPSSPRYAGLTTTSCWRPIRRVGGRAVPGRRARRGVRRQSFFGGVMMAIVSRCSSSGPNAVT